MIDWSTTFHPWSLPKSSSDECFLHFDLSPRTDLPWVLLYNTIKKTTAPSFHLGRVHSLANSHPRSTNNVQVCSTSTASKKLVSRLSLPLSLRRLSLMVWLVHLQHWSVHLHHRRNQVGLRIMLHLLGLTCPLASPKKAQQKRQCQMYKNYDYASHLYTLATAMYQILNIN